MEKTIYLKTDSMPVKTETKVHERPLCGAVAVVGAGIAGIQAALDLSQAGFKVFLLEDSPAVGGRMARLDKTFPTGDCATCIISPKLVECIRDKNIAVITLAEILQIDGEAGNFKIKVKQRPRYIDISKCTGCGDCTEVCPIEIPSPFDEGMGKRKIIDKFYAQAAPNAMVINKKGRAPCSSGCPLDHSIQAYITLIARAKFKEAAAIIRRENPLAEVCGRVCFHPCESECNRGVVDEPLGICRLKRFVLEKEPRDEVIGEIPPSGKRVAIVGSGPAGLAAAHTLSLSGHKAVIFEALPVPGGMLAVGIPDYRLPPAVLKRDLDAVISRGVEIKTRVKVGTDITLTQLNKEYDAVFLATGLHESRKLNIPGEEGKNVLHGVDYLRQAALKAPVSIGKNVLVIGGGNVAIDVALTAVRQCAEKTTLLCLESREEMPAFASEVSQALNEGIVIRNGWGPQEILLKAMATKGMVFKKCVSVFDDERRFRPAFDENELLTLDADTVIVAIGQKSDLGYLEKPEMHNGMTIRVNNETLETTWPGVFAGGDVVAGPGNVVEAIYQGKKAAASIHNYLNKKPLTEGVPLRVKRPNPLSEDELMKLKLNREKTKRVNPGEVPVAERIKDFREVDLTLTEEQAVREAERCLECGNCCECKLCVEKCKADAIDHAQQEKIFEIDAGAVILTPGFEAFNPLKRLEYGIAFYRNVITNVMFERILSASGPTRGVVARPSDGKHPRTMAFIQCVGSRDAKCGNEYCSSVCCMAATKEAILAVEHEPGLKVKIFYMDLRAYGKDFDRYYERAQKKGILYQRARPAAVRENPESGDLFIDYLDGENRFVTEQFDMVILSLGLTPGEKLKSQAECIGIALNAWGFAHTEDLLPLETSRPGIFVAGAFQEPKDIPDTVMQASGAAARAMALLSPARGTLIQEKVYPHERDITDEPPRIGIFVCHCGSNIASVVDVESVVAYARTLANVVYAEHAIYVCSDDTQDIIKEKITEYGLNRVVIASCTPRTHEPIFRDTLKSAGLNQYLLEMANIRDQCSWVHSGDPASATHKAKDLVRMIAGRVASLCALEEEKVKVNNAALIIGGGIAGMTAALELSSQGFPVHLVESEDTLGGLAGEIYKTLDGTNLALYMSSVIRKVRAAGLVKVYTGSRVAKVSGHIGSFTTTIETGGSKVEIKHGVVIVATGAVELKPNTFGYGKTGSVITQLELSGKIARAELKLPAKSTVVMIQCVQQRDEVNPYCSRVCCATAVKNALLILEKNPGAKVIVLYRDMRTYGFSEIAYKKAREKGVVFIRYEKEQPPIVSVNGSLTLELVDPVAMQKIAVTPDLIALSVPVVPRGSREAVSDLLKVPLNADGFFLEAHVKLRPVDFASEGLFLCGTAHAPKFIKETISQASAVAGRAAIILSKTYLPVSGQVAYVDRKKCISCMTCVHLCPYNAPMVNEDNKAEVQGAVCMGCGSCTAECPAKAVTLRNYTDGQVIGAIQNLLLQQVEETGITTFFPDKTGIAQPHWRKG